MKYLVLQMKNIASFAFQIWTIALLAKVTKIRIVAKDATRSPIVLENAKELILIDIKSSVIFFKNNFYEKSKSRHKIFKR